jgi:shikimate kinase
MASDLFAAIYSFYQINIVGSSGCGKSTVGKLIAKKLGLPYIELDEIQ